MNEEIKRKLEKERKISFVNENLLVISHHLIDKDTTEISLNQNGEIWIEKFGVGYINSNEKIKDIVAENIIKVIASYVGKTITRQDPIVDAILPSGDRFVGLLYDIVEGKPVFSIRKRSNKIFTLDEYVSKNILEEHQKNFLEKAILNRKNILVIGGTGTGETTFVNACLQVLNSTKDRIGIIEEVRELQCTAENINFFTTNEYVNFKTLIKANMRLNPDRIILGELREGEETLALLKGWNSGHPGGLSTIHANSNEAGLQKLEQYLDEVTEKPQQAMIVEAINIVVNIVKENNIRKIKEISKVIGYDKELKRYVLEKI